MTSSSWLKSVRNRLSGSDARRPIRHASRLRLEPLEDRCQPSAGILDPTFGNGAGYVTTALSSGVDWGRQVLVQPSGNIVVAGTANSNSSPSYFGAVTYNPDGSLDTAFGAGGIVQQPFVGQGAYRASLYGAALEPTGEPGDAKIVLAGQDSAQGGLALMRLNPNGSLDTTFGGNGQVITQFQTSGNIDLERAGAVAVTSSGQIVALGSDQSYTWLLARYNLDGSLDTTFGSGGKATTVFSSSATAFHTYVTAVAQQPDGKLVVVGTHQWAEPGGAGTTHRGIVVRFNANGSLDTSFGTSGVVTAVVGSLTHIQHRGVAVNAADGKTVVSGMVYTSVSTSEWEVERYNPDGSPDTTFGNGTGSEIIADPQSTTGVRAANAVTIDAYGRAVVAGNGGDGGASPLTMQVARLNPDGSLDGTFGNGGLATTAALGCLTWAVAIQSADGAIVVAGGPSSGKFAVARFLAAASPALVITGLASPTTAGVAHTLTVTAQDIDGNTIVGYAGTVRFTSSDPQAVLPANYTFTADDQGVHTFSATLKTAGTQSIAVVDSGTPVMGGGAIVLVKAATASRLVISGPASTKANTAFSITVTMLDAYGNIATGYTGTVHFSSSDSTGTLPANYTFTAADNGVHTFTGLKLKKKGLQTITVTDTLSSSITGSLAINVI